MTVTARTPTADGADIALAGGWPLVGSSAAKLYLTLAAIGERGDATTTRLSRMSGLGRRTVDSALRELDALGWARIETRRGHGVTWRLRPPPATLTDRAAEYYAARVASAQTRLDDRRAIIDEVMETDAQQEGDA